MSLSKTNRSRRNAGTKMWENLYQHNDRSEIDRRASKSAATPLHQEQTAKKENRGDKLRELNSLLDQISKGKL